LKIFVSLLIEVIRESEVVPMKTKLVAIAMAAGLIFSAGSAAIASAQGGKGQGGKLDGVLSGLVEKGALTQNQVDEIKKAREQARGAMNQARVTKSSELTALITSTIGIDSATITSRLAAGESLGVMAGAKRQALIDALIAFHSKRIDQAVLDGKMSTEDGTKLKAGLSASVTFFVDRVPGNFNGGKGFGKGHGKLFGKSMKSNK
jgi:Spy/CpxP family protein refolding chaperone